MIARRLVALASCLLACVPARAAVARVEPIAASSVLAAPAASAAASAAGHASLSALPLTAVAAPVLSAPAAAASFALAPAAAAAAPAPEPLAARAAEAPSALPSARDEQDRPSAALALNAAAASAQTSPDRVGRLYDAAPAAPDFAALTAVREPTAPVAWRPRASLLKPVAAALNAWRAARHARALDRLGPDQRVTTEELGLRDDVAQIHAALEDGLVQRAVALVASSFLNETALSWYATDSRYRPYRDQALAYMRFAERVGLQAYLGAGRRGQDAALVAEARAAAAAGTALGRAWRPTSIQDKDAGHCALYALYNAISASVGFTSPTLTAQFVKAARASLDRAPSLGRPADPREIAALAAELGVSFGERRVDAGMDPATLREWAAKLGLGLRAAAPPLSAAGWSALIRPGREILLSLRMFHPRFAHAPADRARFGHDYKILHHEVYLLGAFDSPSRGARLFLVQDSGSGATLMATAEELTALTREVDVLETGTAPVALPAAR